MTKITPPPTFPIGAAVLALALALAPEAHARQRVASPSVSPAPSPVPVASPVISPRPMVVVDPVIELNTAAIEAVIERAHNQAMREAALEAEVSAFEAIHEGQGTQREKELEARERAREAAREARDQAREAAREAREAERESQRDREESLEELYDSAMESIDDEDWSDALRPLSKLMSLNSRVDAALYWTGYAQGKMNRAAAALATLARLQTEFPTSRWAKEAKALEMEVRGKSGQTPRPDQEDAWRWLRFMGMLGIYNSWRTGRDEIRWVVIPTGNPSIAFSLRPIDISYPLADMQNGVVLLANSLDTMQKWYEVQ